jgi:hypothetical protein
MKPNKNKAGIFRPIIFDVFKSPKIKEMTIPGSNLVIHKNQYLYPGKSNAVFILHTT